MTDDRSLERAARSWLETGPTEAPDRAVEAALLRIQRTAQERDWRVLRRNQPMTMTARLVAAAIAVAIVAVGGAFVLRSGDKGAGTSPSIAPTNSPQAASPSPSGSPPASPAALLDYSMLGGRILMEHLGNAPDRSEMPTTEYHPERRRLYWMEPASMTGATAVEFLAGQPATGKFNADVSRDGRQVVFMDTAHSADVWIANADGTGLRNLSGECTCGELDPAFDPTGTKIVFVHVEGMFRSGVSGANLGFEWDGVSPVTSWLGIRDLATGAVTKLASTSATRVDGLPYQPAWSPNGKEIAFSRITWETGGNPSGALQVVDVAADAVRLLQTTVQGSPGLDAQTPGDPVWSPDGTTILFTNFPFSIMGSIGDLPESASFTIRPDGTDLKRLRSAGDASYMPDGRIVFQSNYFWVMNADGSEPLPVNARGDDLSELDVGFAYVPHWVGAP